MAVSMAGPLMSEEVLESAGRELTVMSVRCFGALFRFGKCERPPVGTGGLWDAVWIWCSGYPEDPQLPSGRPAQFIVRRLLMTVHVSAAAPASTHG
jgi:hypothetical protein